MSTSLIPFPTLPVFNEFKIHKYKKLHSKFTWQRTNGHIHEGIKEQQITSYRSPNPVEHSNNVQNCKSPLNASTLNKENIFKITTD